MKIWVGLWGWDSRQLGRVGRMDGVRGCGVRSQSKVGVTGWGGGGWGASTGWSAATVRVLMLVVVVVVVAARAAAAAAASRSGG
jgi:hypothetical protein